MRSLQARRGQRRGSQVRFFSSFAYFNAHARLFVRLPPPLLEMLPNAQSSSATSEMLPITQSPPGPFPQASLFSFPPSAIVSGPGGYAAKFVHATGLTPQRLVCKPGLENVSKRVQALPGVEGCMSTLGDDVKAMRKYNVENDVEKLRALKENHVKELDRL